MLLRGHLHDGGQIIILFHGVLAGETFDKMTVGVLLFLLI